MDITQFIDFNPIFYFSCYVFPAETTPHDTPVLHDSNWGDIRMGGVLTGFEGFRATSGRRVLNN